jgi:hypothetical protein
MGKPALQSVCLLSPNSVPLWLHHVQCVPSAIFNILSVSAALREEQFFPLITWELLQLCQDQISGIPVSMLKRAYILSIMCSQSVQLSRRNMHLQLRSPNLSLSCHMTVPDGTCGIAEWDTQVNPGCSVCLKKTLFWDWTRH